VASRWGQWVLVGGVVGEPWVFHQRWVPWLSGKVRYSWDPCKPPPQPFKQLLLYR
jgi:hypothetical protein